MEESYLDGASKINIHGANRVECLQLDLAFQVYSRKMLGVLRVFLIFCPSGYLCSILRFKVTH